MLDLGFALARLPVHIKSLLFLSLLAGCANSFVVGTHSADVGFRSAQFPMRLRYADSARKTFVPGEWLIENERVQEDATKLVAKEGSDYQNEVGFDTDGDGRIDETTKVRRYELLFRNRRTDAQLSLSVFPLDQSQAATDMDVLARDYVDAASGSGSVVISLGPGKAATSSRRFASRILDTATFSVGGQPAAGATFEVANVDQVQLSKDALWERARVVLVRAPWRWIAGSEDEVSSWPVVVRILYSNRPERFEQDAPSLEALVGALQFGETEAKLAHVAPAMLDCVAGSFHGNEATLLFKVDEAGEVLSPRMVAPGVRIYVGSDQQSCLYRKAAMKRTWASGVEHLEGFTIRRDGAVPSRASMPANAKPFAECGWPHAPDKVPTPAQSP